MAWESGPAKGAPLPFVTANRKIAASVLGEHLIRSLVTTRPIKVESGNYFPSGVVTSVPAGGVNSNIDAGIGARVSFE